ncbi:hypothetical protein PTTG_26139 [Puccinia triticina 1-1 BBBD Race 1]|uniref:Uncharacterized protein n=1 Tax=Puccinia triticina (isolate 1-1 / race 1 (BBBD)) TaxID=630390 RepID=A0A180GXK5_PUCT1|nr:hypothetical protein PTTG_26139 [Puccinia triticina 1-1 BBBD Race 1]
MKIAMMVHWFLRRGKTFLSLEMMRPGKTFLSLERLSTQGGALPIETIINGLKVENLKSKIKRENWLDKFSHESCASFLPLRTGPGSKETEPVYLLYVNGNHWALALVEGEDGVKPIPPPILATKNTLKCAKAWYNYVQKGVDLYQDKATKAT